jgi:O-antigen/teichoic acid export membrane protein
MNLKPKNSLLRNGVYNLAGGAIRISLGIAVIPILIRFLGIEEYGLWTLATSILGIVNLAEAGLSTATTVFISQDLSDGHSGNISETITVSLVGIFLLATTAAISLYLSSGWIVQWYTKLILSQSSDLLLSLQIGSLVIWLKLFQQVLVGIEQAYQRYDLINIVGTFSSILTSVGMIAIVLSSGKTLQLMQYQLFASFVVLLLHAYLVRYLIGKKNTRFKLTLSKFLEIGKYSSMMWITSIGGVLFTRVDRLVIGFVLGSKYLGIYSVITDIASQINSLSAMAVQPIISSISNEVNIKSKLVQKQVKKSLLANLYIALFLGLLINALAPLILSLLLKSNIKDINNVYLLSFKLGILIYSIYSVNGSSYYVLLGAKRVDICSAISLIVGICSIILIYVGATNLGLVGAILGNAGFLGVYSFTFFSMSIIGIPLNDYFKDVFYPIACMLTASIMLLFVGSSITMGIFISSLFLLFISFLVKKSMHRLNLSDVA